MRRRLTISFLTLAICAFWACSAEACPTCKAAVAENGGNLVRGYFWSILFMMSMPFLIVGGLGSLFYMEVRKARLASAQPAAELSQQERCPVAVDSRS